MSLSRQNAWMLKILRLPLAADIANAKNFTLVALGIPVGSPVRWITLIASRRIVLRAVVGVGRCAADSTSEWTMRRMAARWSWAAVAACTILVAASHGLRGQDAGQKPGPDAKAGPSPKEAEAAIKPLPLEAIPDDPPPHEGALFEISYRIEPPDVLVVEVLEALPGRPITGEKLVRPDGTISLDWYGDVHVAGLTRAQAKAKILHHLRPFLIDEALGLLKFDDGPGVGPVKARGTVEKGRVRAPVEESPARDRPANPAERGHHVDPFDPIPPFHGRRLRQPIPPAELPPLPGDPKQLADAIGEAGKAAQVPPKEGVGKYVWVAPEDSDRVFVDVMTYNSKVYHVIGDAANLGRLTWTGKETVLDAIHFAGGFLPSADRHNIRLNRPARGGKPAKSYKIDLDAIEKGDKKANLQVFPDDRLIIGRKGEPWRPGGE